MRSLPSHIASDPRGCTRASLLEGCTQKPTADYFAFATCLFQALYWSFPSLFQDEVRRMSWYGYAACQGFVHCRRLSVDGKPRLKVLLILLACQATLRPVHRFPAHRILLTSLRRCRRLLTSQIDWPSWWMTEHGDRDFGFLRSATPLRPS
jgi:hypothetical protein